MKTVLALMMLFATNSAFANVAIECGTEVNFEDGAVGKRNFLISSEDGENFKAYDSKDQEIKNSKVQLGSDQALVLTIATDQGLGGPVGTEYVIANYSGENFTTAIQYVVGGFAGGTKVGELDCVVSEL